MATNFVQDGKVLDLEIANVKAGDPVAVGELVGVALTDTDINGKVRVLTEGIFNLEVKAVDDSGNKAIAVGDYVNYVAGDTPHLSKKSGIRFGIALEAIDAGTTATIKVKIAAK